MNTITITLDLPLNADQEAALAALTGGNTNEAAPAAKRGRKPKDAEPAPTAAAAPAEPEMSSVEFQAVLARSMKALGGPDVKAVFATFNAKKFSDLKPSDYAKVAQALDAAIAAKTSAEDLTA